MEKTSGFSSAHAGVRKPHSCRGFSKSPRTLFRRLANGFKRVSFTTTSIGSFIQLSFRQLFKQRGSLVKNFIKYSLVRYAFRSEMFLF